MNTLPAQEIKRKGISAVDKALHHGDVHIIKNNTPQYVVLSEARYNSLIAAEEETTLARVKASLQDVAKGDIHHFSTVEKLIKEMGLDN